MLKFELGFDVNVSYAVPPVAIRVPDVDHQKFAISYLPVLGFAFAGALFLLVSLWFLCCYCLKVDQARLRLYRIIGRMEVGEVLINVESVQPVEDPVDHPIWYIRTQGLQQSVIDSISVVKYKKNEGLVEGSDCSICLSEFEEDESLRLLPKCAHAFHVPCIDQWFRSHKNCPLCRSPVAIVAVGGATVVSAEEVGSRQVEQENQVGLEGQQSDETVTGAGVVNISHEDSDSSASENGRNGSVANKQSSFSGSSKSNPESGLAESHKEDNDEVLQPMRRSVSAGPVASSNIYGAMAEIKILVESNASPDSGCSPLPPKTQRTSMKRSASYGGKPSSAKSRQSQKSILPY